MIPGHRNQHNSGACTVVSMDEKKILVIDDEGAIRYLLEGQLRRAGFMVYAAPDGPSGLALLPTFQPDLVILDIMMPEMDGFEVCRRIRCHAQAADTPIIFLSGSSTPEYKRLAFELGADDFLVKPFQTDELPARIEAVFRRRGRRNDPDKEADKTEQRPAPGRVISLIGVDAGLGATTLAVQLSETIALHSNWPVLLIDLDLCAGRIAGQLKLFHEPHIVNLFQAAAGEPLSPSLVARLVQQYAQPHQAGLNVIAAPAQPTAETLPRPGQLALFLQTLADAGFYVVLDLGVAVNEQALVALQQSDLVYVVTPGRPPDGKRFSELAAKLVEQGIHDSQIVPVVGETQSRSGQPAINRTATGKRKKHFWSENGRLHQLVGAVA